MDADAHGLMEPLGWARRAGLVPQVDFTLSFLGLAGSIALLLWGTHMVQTGIQRAFGANLRAFLAKALRRRLAALSAGVGITVILQSSTATCLMAVNFAAGGLVALVPAMAIMLGANVGTALIVTVLSFNVAALSAPLVLVGVVMFRSRSNATSHDLGRVFIGVGLMLLALHQMIGTLEPISGSEDFLTILGVLSNLPVIAIALGAIAAFAVHSSVAVVLLIASLATHGAVGLDTALLMVIGANIGTALNPLLESSGNASAIARRLPLANLGNRVLGLLIAAPAMSWIVGGLDILGFSGASAVAAFHLAFNLVLALAMLPLLGPVADVLVRLVPDRMDPASPALPRYLDPAAREVPAVALAGAAREALRLADALEAMLEDARAAMTSTSRKQIAAAKAREDILDGLNSAIRHYLAGLEHDALGQEEERSLHQILTFATNMEQAGDVIEGTLLPHVGKRLKRGLLPNQGHVAELVAMMDRLIQNTRKAASLMMTEDARLARELAEEKLVFRQAEQLATSNHFLRMRDGIDEASRSEAIQVDLMRDMKLINSHIVAAAAYPVLDRVGELLPMRLAGATSRD